MYGGRVTDDCDRRVVETYMNEYLGDFLFDAFQPFHFFQDEESRCGRPGVDYCIPALGDRSKYLQAIEKFPGIEAQTPEVSRFCCRRRRHTQRADGSAQQRTCAHTHARAQHARTRARGAFFSSHLITHHSVANSLSLVQVFGLHPNAEIDYLTSASKKLWRDLIDLQPRQVGGGGGITREEYIGSIATDIESKMPPLFDLNKLRKELERDGFSPVFVVLVQELERWEKLNLRMAKTLSQLKMALKGEIAMSNDLDALGTNLFNGQLPDMWRKLTPQTDKMLGSWMTFHGRRHAQYSAWVADGEPKVMWLSGLSIPETYTAALVQTTCRRYGWPLDKTTLYTKVTKYTKPEQVTEKLTDGCYVTGLYLEGAAWDTENQCLVRQPPKVLVQDLPILQVVPVELNKLKLHGTIRVPLYITQQRRNAMGVGMMMEADLDTREHSSHWVLQGVALVLNIDT